MPKKLDFITPATLKVLEFFFENPMEEFHEREVMRKSKISKGSANNILNKLARLNLLVRKNKGRMVFYKLCMKNPVVKQFKILYNIFELNDFIDEIKKISDKVILFGSCSEGTNVKESDIDVLIITEEKNSVKKYVSIFNEKNMIRISPIIVNFNEFLKLKREDKPLYDRIERGIILWEKE
jgi:predicted nucleotidyltransferase